MTVKLQNAILAGEKLAAKQKFDEINAIPFIEEARKYVEVSVMKHITNATKNRKDGALVERDQIMTANVFRGIGWNEIVKAITAAAWEESISAMECSLPKGISFAWPHNDTMESSIRRHYDDLRAKAIAVEIHARAEVVVAGA